MSGLESPAQVQQSVRQEAPLAMQAEGPNHIRILGNAGAASLKDPTHTVIEDTVSIGLLVSNDALERSPDLANVRVGVVCDGVGGDRYGNAAGNGHLASRAGAIAINNTYASLRGPSTSRENAETNMRAAIANASHDVQNLPSKASSTVVAYELYKANDGKIYATVGSKGDSRAYVARKGPDGRMTLTQLTFDHGAVRERFANDPAYARKVLDYFDTVRSADDIRDPILNLLYKERNYIGNSLSKEGGKPDIITVEIGPDDLILLGSDGFYENFLGTQAIQDEINRGGTPQEIATRLVAYAQRAGKKQDDIAVAVATYRATATPAPAQERPKSGERRESRERQVDAVRKKAEGGLRRGEKRPISPPSLSRLMQTIDAEAAKIPNPGNLVITLRDTVDRVINGRTGISEIPLEGGMRDQVQALIVEKNRLYKALQGNQEVFKSMSLDRIQDTLYLTGDIKGSREIVYRASDLIGLINQARGARTPQERELIINNITKTGGLRDAVARALPKIW